MEKSEFKKLFGSVAKQNGFVFQYGGWFKETPVCIVSLDLQRSNYSALYYLNIKIYIQGLLGNRYKISKELIKDIGDVFRRHPPSYDEVFDLENEINEEKREFLLKSFFCDFLSQMIHNLNNLDDVKSYIISEGLYVCDPVKEYLSII